MTSGFWDKFDSKISNKFKWVAAILPFIALVVIFANMLPGIIELSQKVDSSSGIENFNTGWEIVAPADEAWGNTAVKINLPSSVDSQPGQQVSITNTLPDSIDPGTGIEFFSNRKTVTVTIGDEVVYTWDDHDTRAYSKAPPSKWNYVQLTPEMAGEDITISLTSPYLFSSGVLEPVFIGPMAELQTSLLHYYIPFEAMVWVLFGLGVLMVILALIFSRSATMRNVQMGPLKYAGFFAVMCALYGFLSLDIPRNYVLLEYIDAPLGFVFLMLMPLPLILYMRSKTRKGDVFCKILNILFILFVLNFIVCFALQTLRVADFEETIMSTLILIIIVVATMLVIYINSFIKRKNRSSIPEIIGFILQTLLLIAEFAYSYLGIPTPNVGFFITGALIYVLCIFMTVFHEIVQNISRQHELDMELRENKLRLMARQIKPHFIYNTLNAIYGQITVAPELASELTYIFSKYLRANVDYVNAPALISFAKELETIKAYARIEEIRYDGKIKVNYDIGPDMFAVPALSIQPLVENAIKHGLLKKKTGGQVVISTRETEDSYIIQVSDDGVGFSEDNAAKTNDESTGLRNVMFRLKELADADVDIHSESNVGTTVRVIIPKNSEKAREFSKAQNVQQLRGTDEDNIRR